MESEKIVALWRRACRRGENVFLATILRVEGPAYRKPGARMLVTASGEREGTVSGGCLEAEIAKKIAWHTRDGAVIRSYRTSFEEDGDHGYGSGCGGTVWLLLESGERAVSVLETIAAAWEQRKSSVALYDLQGGLNIFIHQSADPRMDCATVGETRKHAALQSLRSGKVVAGPDSIDSDLPAFVCIPAVPPPHLHIFGAGDDARPLAAIAAELGWHVTVADGRAQLLRQDRFPSARKRQHIHYVSATVSTEEPPSGLLQPLAAEAGDLAVVLTHSFVQDRAILKSLLNLQLQYIGVLGPRQRTRRLLESIVGPNEAEIAAAFARIHSPVGLSIGAKDPSTIALAILAEMQATLTGKTVTVQEERTATEILPPRPSARSFKTFRASEDEHPPCVFEVMDIPPATASEPSWR